MKKKIIIECCADCIHYSAFGFSCRKKNKTVKDSKKIPDWCPLPDEGE